MEREWLGGRYTMGSGDLFMWLELPTGILLDLTSIDPNAPVTFGETLHDAMSEPGYGPPRRPDRIRVPEQSLADALRKSAGGIPVTIAPVPELDDVFADLVATMQAMPAEDETVHQMDFRFVTAIAAELEVGPASFDDDEVELMIPFTAWTARVDGERAADRFFAAHVDQLSDAERDWFDAQREAWLSIWEITHVEPGRITVRDVLTRAKRTVHEEIGSRHAEAGGYVLARMIDYRGESYFGGMHSRVFPPQAGALVASTVRRQVGGRTISTEQLRDPDLARWMIGTWTDIVRAVLRERGN